MINKKNLKFFLEYGYLKIKTFSLNDLRQISKSFQNFLVKSKNINFEKFRESLKSFENISKKKFQKKFNIFWEF